ncbi:dipeptidase [Desulforamulus ruminis]|uniref:Membrane dipeptidase n=1 Tax=Desulforamulus ruminis (strain ATCC 23193 / DSM 2154 / NCIMB 8452 / DL) TaxID=696281 RepID=F6DUR7_DESRL|nr:dipeptidase [Desulforamulus ruminis]AEG60205.1 Membrane dipeptidase [Desulforamulus ruminis DSM 2154]
MPVIDAHCDTLTVLGVQNRKLGVESAQGHLDLPRLKKGGIDVQFFAVFVSPDAVKTPAEYTWEIIDLFHEEMAANQGEIEKITCYAELRKVLDLGKKGAVLTIEGGEALHGKIELLHEYYQSGVRGLTLTWNGRNELGDGVGMGAAAAGLTSFGRMVVQEMSRLGMMVDVSHLSSPGFWDVIKEVKTPVMASHSNCWSICNHPRNLTDRQIRAIAGSGGVIGVTYVPQFIHDTVPNLERLLDHIDHLYKVGGIACIGLGSDFDGIDQLPEALDSAQRAVPNIKKGLLQRKYSQDELDKILGDNWLRLFKEVCG